MGSLSLTIIFGVPCNFGTVSMNAIATVLALKGCDSKMFILGKSINNHHDDTLSF